MLIGKTVTKKERFYSGIKIGSRSPKGDLSLTGFTLIELLVASAITGVLITICFVSFKTGTDSWIKSEARIQRYQNARGALEMMAREISGAVVDSVTLSFRGFNGSSGWRTDSGADELYFIAPVENSGDGDLCEIGYWLNGPDNILMRHYKVTDKAEDPPLDFDFSTGSSNQLGLHVTNLQFEYWNGSSWQNTWDSSSDGGLPTKVKITIFVQDERELEKEQEFSTVVYLPNSQ